MPNPTYIKFLWDDDADELRGYCWDDDTEFFLVAKWDDVNDYLDIKCEFADFPVYWDDTNDYLSADVWDESGPTDNFPQCCMCDICCDSARIDSISYTLAGTPSDDGTATLLHQSGSDCTYYCDDGVSGFECNTGGGFTEAWVAFCYNVDGETRAAAESEAWFAIDDTDGCRKGVSIADEYTGGVTHSWTPTFKS